MSDGQLQSCTVMRLYAGLLILALVYGSMVAVELWRSHPWGMAAWLVFLPPSVWTGMRVRPLQPKLAAERGVRSVPLVEAAGERLSQRIGGALCRR